MKIDLGGNKRSIYSSVAYQLFLMFQVKKPLMDSLEMIFRVCLHGKRKEIQKFRKALRAIDKLPEPAAGNTRQANTGNILYLRSWLYRRLMGKVIKRLAGRLIKLGIIIYDFDPPWRWVMDNLKDRALEMDWHIWRVIINLVMLKKWISQHCFLGGARDGIIRKFFVAAVILCLIFPPVQWTIGSIMTEAKKMNWQPRNQKDNWDYWWWDDKTQEP